MASSIFLLIAASDCLELFRGSRDVELLNNLQLEYDLLRL